MTPVTLTPNYAYNKKRPEHLNKRQKSDKTYRELTFTFRWLVKMHQVSNSNWRQTDVEGRLDLGWTLSLQDQGPQGPLN